MNDQQNGADARLDELLRMWANSARDDQYSHEEALQSIIASAGNGQMLSIPSRRVWPVVAACVSAVILLAIVTSIPFLADPYAATFSSKSPSERQVNVLKLWSRMVDVFGPQLNWICDLDGELLMKLDEDAATYSVGERAIVLLTVQVRESTSEKWTAVWTGRVVCPLGSAVDFVSNTSHSGGTIWVQTRPNGMVVASHWLNWPEHPEISGSIDVEVSPGEERVVSRQVVDGHSIQVIQQVLIPVTG